MFKRLWRHSFLFYLIQYASHAIANRNDKKQYGNLFYNGFFSTLAKTYLHVDLKKDWIGRMYGIINPNVDIDGNFDPSTMIIEIDGENTNNNEYVHSWIAANYIMTYYSQHNICPMTTRLPAKTDTIMVNRNIHLEQVACVGKRQDAW